MSLLLPLLGNFGLKSRQCPTEQQLSEYADQQLIGNERRAIEQHLATCRECLTLVGFLIRTGEDRAAVPPELLRVAKVYGVAGAAPKRYMGWAAAAAATVAIVVAIGTWELTDKTPTSNSPQDRTREVQQAYSIEQKPPVGPSEQQPQMRGSRAQRVAILMPTPGTIVPAGAVEFQWEALPSADYYEVEVVTVTGDPVWNQRSNDTSAKLPATVHLVRGNVYYVWVRVHSRTSGVSQSSPVRFIAG